MKKILLATACAVAQIATSLPAAAQTPAPADRQVSGAEELGEIVVTAERRRTNLQTTPISATVMTGEDVANSGVTTVDQLQFISPAATVNNFGQGIDFNIRGIGKAEHNTQTTTGVITYRDGVATFPGYFTAEPYYDIARVEILRGPQGTFVGQNATGGAVFVTSQDPVINGGYRRLHPGRRSATTTTFGAQGAINLPVSDTFAARIAFNGEQPRQLLRHHGPVHRRRRRSHRQRPPRHAVGAERATCRCSSRPTTTISISAAIPSDPVNATNGLFDITANAEMHGAATASAARCSKIDYEFANGTTLRSVSGYQEGRTEYRADLDGTSVGNNIFGDAVDETIYSQEINLISPDAGRFKWILGAYYQHDEYEFPPGEFYIGMPTGFYLLEGTNPKETIGRCSARSSFGLAGRLGAAGRRALLATAAPTNHISVNQYGLPLTQEQKAKFYESLRQGRAQLDGRSAPLPVRVRRHRFPAGRPQRAGGPRAARAVRRGEGHELRDRLEGGLAGRQPAHAARRLLQRLREFPGHRRISGHPGVRLRAQQSRAPTEIYGFEAQLEAVFGDFSLDAGVGWLQSSSASSSRWIPRDPSFGACDPRDRARERVVHQSRGARSDLCAGLHLQSRHAVRLRAWAAATRSRRGSTTATCPSNGRRCSRTRRAAIASRRATS